MTPPGTWLEVHARLLQDPGWSRWYSLGAWASDGSAIRRHSVAGRDDDRARVDTDTLIAPPGFPASGYQLNVTLFGPAPAVSPAVRLAAAAAAPLRTPAQRVPSGVELDVPQRSQMRPEYRGLGFGGGGEGGGPAGCADSQLTGAPGALEQRLVCARLTSLGRRGRMWPCSSSEPATVYSRLKATGSRRLD